MVEKFQQQVVEARQEAIMAGAAKPASGIKASVTSVLPQDPKADSCNPAETVEVLGSGAELRKGPHEAGDSEGAQPEAVYEVGPWLPAAQRCVRLSAATQSVYNMVFQQVSKVAEQEMFGALDSCHAYPTVSVGSDSCCSCSMALNGACCVADLRHVAVVCGSLPPSSLSSLLARKKPVLGILLPIQMS